MRVNPARIAAAAVRPVEAAPAVGGEGAEEFGEHLVEGRDGQPGHAAEDGGVLAQVLAAQDHGGLDSGGALSCRTNPAL
jgi:hypothetical protein